MAPTRHHYVLNLADWELLRLDDLEWTRVDRLADTAHRIRFRPILSMAERGLV
jgi:hypothetical protein